MPGTALMEARWVAAGRYQAGPVGEVSQVLLEHCVTCEYRRRCQPDVLAAEHRSDRQTADSHAVLVEHDDGACVEVIDDRVEVGQDQCGNGVHTSPVVAS